MNRALIIGVTGGFGTGKTALAGILKKLGARIIDADKIAHRLLMPGNLVYKKTISKFGENVLRMDNTIDRDKLAAIIFNDAKKLSSYSNIIHPAIIKEIKLRINGMRKTGNGIIVLDAPLLIEAGLDKDVDRLIVVKAIRERQLARLEKRTGLSKKDILKRIKFQLPLSEKAKIADYIIDNNGTLYETEKQARKIWESLSRLV